MKKLVFLLLVLYGFFSAAAQHGKHEIFYYYNGIKVYKVVSQNRLLVYYSKDADEKRVAAQYSCSNVQRSADKDSPVGFYCEVSLQNTDYASAMHTFRSDSMVLYVEPAIGEDPIFSSRFFYVQLKKMNDIDVLLSEAKKIGAEVIREIPYSDGWFSLNGQARCGKTSIELSNLMWETGLFKNVDPGFMPKITYGSACVSDSRYESHQWNLQRINACDAWEITTGDPSIRVAVLDRGMRLDHVELKHLNLVYSIDLESGNPASSSVCYCDNAPYNPPDCHGAHVGGIIFSDHNHGEIAGVSPNVSALDLSLRMTGQEGDIAKYTEAIYFAVAHGARVINNSWGLRSLDSSYALLEGALESAKRNNVLLVFISGNEAPRPMRFPARNGGHIMVVGSSSQDDKRANNSCYGSTLDIVAPGINILSTWGTDSSSYETLSGTSMAAPLVSGVAALMLSVRPELNAMQVHDIINATAQKVNPSIYPYTDDPDHPNGTWNEEMGYGLLDAYAAVRMAQTYDGVSDLMIRDHEHDHGVVPSTDPILWNSPDIWLVDEGGCEWENPLGGEFYYVCVRITNRSPIASSGGEKLYVNWAKAGCDLRWSSSWDGSSHFNCSNGQPLRGACLNEGDPLIVPPIPAGGSCVLKVPWQVPHPENYASCTQFESEMWHFCLVARVHDGEGIEGESRRNYDMGRFVSESNNVAWKNVSVINRGLHKAVVSVSNPFNETANFRIRLKSTPNKKGEYIHQHSDLIVQLDNGLMPLWYNSGGQCHGGIDMGGGRILVKDSVLLIENLPLPPRQHFTVATAIHFHTQAQSIENRFEFDLLQEHGSTIIGGEHYIAHKDPSILFRAGILASGIDVDGNITLGAEDIGADAEYILHSAAGDTLPANARVSTRSMSSQRYVLEVTASENGYRDRDTLTLHPRLGAILAVAPNPVAGGQTEVSLRLAATLGGATLQVVNNLGQALLVQPVAPTADGSATATLNLQGIPTGQYQLRLTAGTTLVDIHTLIVQ